MFSVRKGSLLANLFPAAHPVLDESPGLRWHGGADDLYDAYKLHSSQALTIDVFGTLRGAASRDAVLDALAAQLNLPVGGPWHVELEWHDPDNLLREKQPTWVDAVARSPHALIFFEGKFTESDGGSCSHTQRLTRGKHAGLRQCTGSYMWQTNPINGAEARCALSAKGVRYWEVVPHVFDYDADAGYFECPFAGPWFQWMRNLTLCHAVARQHGLRPAVVVAYADAPGLPMAARVRSAEWERLLGRLQRGGVPLRAMAYQSLVSLACRAAPNDDMWPALAGWVQRKISAVSEAKVG